MLSCKSIFNSCAFHGTHAIPYLWHVFLENSVAQTSLYFSMVFNTKQNLQGIIKSNVIASNLYRVLRCSTVIYKHSVQRQVEDYSFFLKKKRSQYCKPPIKLVASTFTSTSYRIFLDYWQESDFYKGTALMKKERKVS